MITPRGFGARGISSPLLMALAGAGMVTVRRAEEVETASRAHLMHIDPASNDGDFAMITTLDENGGLISVEQAGPVSDEAIARLKAQIAQEAEDRAKSEAWAEARRAEVKATHSFAMPGPPRNQSREMQRRQRQAAKLARKRQREEAENTVRYDYCRCAILREPCPYCNAVFILAET